MEVIIKTIILLRDEQAVSQILIAFFNLLLFLATSALFSEPGYRYEIKKRYEVTNPRELIHQFATTTPVQTIPGWESLPDGGTTTRVTKQSYSSSTEET